MGVSWRFSVVATLMVHPSPSIDGFRMDISMTRIFLGTTSQKTRVTKSVFWEQFFFRTNNRVKNFVKTFQWATAYLPTHSLKSPAFLVPATLDDEGKNANFPSTPPHCRRRHRRRSSRRIIHECSWKPVGHGTHFKPFITSRVPTFLSICLSVCLMW